MESESVRIGFDLDETLIPAYPGQFPVEWPRCRLVHFFVAEPLRRGTTELLRALKQQGHSLAVYTTSLRSPSHVRALFLCYGFWIGRVINQQRHFDWLRAQNGRYDCSKFPPAFGIDLLVDDAEGVRIEGRQHGFRVVRVAPEDEKWTTKVLNVLASVYGKAMGL